MASTLGVTSRPVQQHGGRSFPDSEIRGVRCWARTCPDVGSTASLDLGGCRPPWEVAPENRVKAVPGETPQGQGHGGSAPQRAGPGYLQAPVLSCRFQLPGPRARFCVVREAKGPVPQTKPRSPGVVATGPEVRSERRAERWLTSARHLGRGRSGRRPVPDTPCLCVRHSPCAWLSLLLLLLPWDPHPVGTVQSTCYVEIAAGNFTQEHAVRAVPRLVVRGRPALAQGPDRARLPLCSP